jgi:hypothetical protein
MRWQLWCVDFTDEASVGQPCPWALYWLRSTAERKARQVNAANMATNGLHYYVDRPAR